MTNLNTNENLVLKGIVMSADKHAGGDFTYIEYIDENTPNTITINQIKGYLTILQKKEFILCCEGGQICAGDKFNYSNFNNPNYIGA
tara:strand:- start:477 stop:737 length:261 start_codon:yes stop_codon:yes gene_type:complete